MKYLRPACGFLATLTVFAAVTGRCQLAPTGPGAFDTMIRSASSFDADAPAEARAEFDPPEGVVGGKVLYRVSVTALDESFELPDKFPLPAGLELQRGGRGQNYEPTGANKIRARTTIIFHATLTTNGSFTIPAFQAMAYGKPVEIPAATITVAPAGTGAPEEPSLLLVTPPRGTVYVGQALGITLTLTQEPPHVVPLLSEARITGDFIFSEQFVSAMRPGNIQRDGRSVPASLEDVTITPVRAGPQKFVGQAFTYVTRPVPGQPGVMPTESQLLDSEPFTLDVQPLPKNGELAGFTGAVGQFKVDPPTLSASTVRAGEPLTLTILIRGSGNIGRILPPEPPSARDWQTFPATGEDLPPEVAHQIGSIRFSYTMIPLNDRISATPPIPFSSFDPETKSYTDLTIPGVPLTVQPSPAGAIAQTGSSPADLARANTNDAPEEKELTLADVTKTPGWAMGGLTPVQQRAWFWALQLVLASVLAGLWGWDRRRRFLREHPEVILKRRARRGMRRELRIARRAAAARDAAAFARSGAGALREACAPHGAANPAALVCADVLQELPPADRQGGGAEMVRRLFAAADALNFGGPAREGPELLALEPELERVLEQLKTRL